jgi:hypothetical protein
MIAHREIFIKRLPTTHSPRGGLLLVHLGDDGDDVKGVGGENRGDSCGVHPSNLRWFYIYFMVSLFLRPPLRVSNTGILL